METKDMSETESPRICHGCGAVLQTQHEHLPGYVPEDALLREPPLCRRCYRIRHYGEFPTVEISAAEQEAEVLLLKSEPGLVLYIVDGFDLQGSLIRNLSQYTGDYPLLVLVNKTDLFPKEVKLHRLAEWVKKLVQRQGAEPKQVLFVSGKSGAGLEELVDFLESSQFERVFVLGRANVGKSTLLNRLAKRFRAGEPFTTSRVPGTTLGLTDVSITLPSSKGVLLVDVPGLVQGDRLTDVLCPDCLRAVLPNTRMRPRVFQLNPGQSLWIGGFVRFDFESGAPQSIVCYISNDLVIHRTKIERADDFGHEHRFDILKVPCRDCEAKLGEVKPIQIRGGRRRAGVASDNSEWVFSQPTDIVLPGLGWLALSGSSLRATLWTRNLISVQTRPRLLGVLTRLAEAAPRKYPVSGSRKNP